MKEDYQSGNQQAKPTVTTYTILINTLSKSNSNMNNGKDTNNSDDTAPLKAELLLLEMIELYETGVLLDSPNTIVYSSVINCWSKSNRPEAPQRCFDILQTMRSKYEEANDNDTATTSGRSNNSVIRPDRITYNSVMNAYAKRGDVEGAKKVWKMMIEEAHIAADVQTYNTLIDAWSKSGHKNAPEEAGLLLMEMIDVSNQNKKGGSTHHHHNNNNNIIVACPVLGCRPDTITYTGVINCWSKSHRPEAPSRALDILQIMISKSKEENDGSSSTVQPNTITYNSVMDAHAKQGDVEGALQVFSLMKKEGSAASATSCTPDVTTYTILIDAYSKKANKNWNKNNKNHHDDDIVNAPLEAEALLMEMIELYKHGLLQDGPNTITYAAVINCWSKSKRPEAPQRAMDILQTMRSTYQKQHQQQQQQSKNKNDDTNNTHAEQQHKKGRRKNIVNSSSSTTTNNNVVRPNTIVYSTVMDAYAKQGDVDGAKHVFTMMKEDYYNAGNINAKPNRFAYTTIIDAYSKSNHHQFPKAPLEAEATLMEMIDLYSKGEIEEGPNTIVYSAVINCWSKSNRPEGPSRCLDILKTMISKYKEDGNVDVKPDIITYNSIIDAHVRQGDMGGAMNVFQMMWNKQEDSNVNDNHNHNGNTNNTAIKNSQAPNPNVLTYNILIDGWSKSGMKDASIEVENLLREMLTTDHHHHHNNNNNNNNNENDGGSINEKGRGKRSLPLTPDDTTYALIIKCLEKYPGTEDRVRELKEIVKTKDAGVKAMLEEEQASK